MQNVTEVRRISNAYTPRVTDTVNLSPFKMPSAFSLVRDVVLPVTTETLPQVVAVENHYRRLTGRELPTHEAVRLLDQIRADRPSSNPFDPRPIRTELLPIAAWLLENGYEGDAVYLTCREIERTGSARLSPSLDGEDIATVEDMIPESVREMAAQRQRFDAMA